MVPFLGRRVSAFPDRHDSVKGKGTTIAKSFNAADV